MNLRDHCPLPQDVSWFDLKEIAALPSEINDDLVRSVVGGCAAVKRRGKPGENHGKTRGNPGKTMGKLGKTMGKSWENHGKTMHNLSKIQRFIIMFPSFSWDLPMKIAQHCHLLGVYKWVCCDLWTPQISFAVKHVLDSAGIIPLFRQCLKQNMNPPATQRFVVLTWNVYSSCKSFQGSRNATPTACIHKHPNANLCVS